jgi:transcriptional regulator with XRE-family HTH domain
MSREDRLNISAQRLQELCRELSANGLKQAAVARQVGVPSQYLSDVLNGHRPLTELFARRLGEEFGVNYAWLLATSDSKERPFLTPPPATQPHDTLPLVRGPIAGLPQDDPEWPGSYVQHSAIYAHKAAQLTRPYVLQLAHGDVAGRLQENDLILVSQDASAKAEVAIVQCGEELLLARKKGVKWHRVATGRPVRGKCEVKGHCVGIIWSKLA